MVCPRFRAILLMKTTKGFTCTFENQGDAISPVVTLSRISNRWKESRSQEKSLFLFLTNV